MNKIILTVWFDPRWNWNWRPFCVVHGVCPCLHAQVFTNGRYKSVEHRVIVDGKKERLSMATFHSPSKNAIVAPLSEMVAHEDDAVYTSMDHDELLKLFFAMKLEGKNFLNPIKKLKNSGWPKEWKGDLLCLQHVSVQNRTCPSLF